MSSSEKKKRKKTPTTTKPSPEPTPNPSLPNDLLLSCFARASRLYYPTLSLVSKSFQSLLTSPELYQTRSLLNRTESCLYVCLTFSDNSNPRWFTLCRKPNRTLSTKSTNKTKKKKKKSFGYVLAPIPVSHCSQAYIWERGVVSVGSNIYAIGGPVNRASLANVSVLDCRSYEWREAPKMRAERSFAFSNVVDGKIYVAGGIKDTDDSSNRVEVFNTKTQAWELVVSPIIERCNTVYKNAVIDENIYIYGRNIVAYKPKDDKWEEIGSYYFELDWVGNAYCVVDNVLYCYGMSQVIKWYDSKMRNWIVLKGVDGLPKIAGYGLVRLVEYGGKLVVLWDKYLPSSGYKNKVIWCAVIALERRNCQEIWGMIEWLDPVLTVPDTYGFVCAVAATV